MGWALGLGGQGEWDSLSVVERHLLSLEPLRMNQDRCPFNGCKSRTQTKFLSSLGGVGVIMRWGRARGSGPGIQAELSLGLKLTLTMALPSLRSWSRSACWINRNVLSLLLGPLHTQRAQKCISRIFPSFTPKTCSGRPVLPIVHRLPSRFTELSFQGVSLGSPPFSIGSPAAPCPQRISGIAVLDEVLLGCRHLCWEF